jgi:hypothetical protein
MWCDNVPQQESVFRQALAPFLGGDTDILEDALHVIMRYGRAVEDKHPLKGKIAHDSCTCCTWTVIVFVLMIMRCSNSNQIIQSVVSSICDLMQVAR